MAGGDSDIAAIGALVSDPGRCRMLLDLGWIARSRHNRAVTVTPAGRAGLRDTFRLDLDGDRARLLLTVDEPARFVDRIRAAASGQ